jgi:hypothetical protein
LFAVCDRAAVQFVGFGFDGLGDDGAVVAGERGDERGQAVDRRAMGQPVGCEVFVGVVAAVLVPQARQRVDFGAPGFEPAALCQRQQHDLVVGDDVDDARVRGFDDDAGVIPADLTGGQRVGHEGEPAAQLHRHPHPGLRDRRGQNGFACQPPRGLQSEVTITDTARVELGQHRCFFGVESRALPLQVGDPLDQVGIAVRGGVETGLARRPPMIEHVYDSTGPTSPRATPDQQVPREIVSRSGSAISRVRAARRHPGCFGR